MFHSTEISWLFVIFLFLCLFSILDLLKKNNKYLKDLRDELRKFNIRS
ncbi:MAG: hypothetical protein K0R71_15 [Bacillales bacterium]|jgi:hypothetical protein|nr:hypothetical protein [Bacillales bacterium]